MQKPYKVAILDDYQQVALSMADWSPLNNLVEITVFKDHVFEENALVDRLNDFTIICVMRERTPLTESIFKRLPNLQLVVSTGKRNASINVDAADANGVGVRHTGYIGSGAPELTWALLLAIAKHIPQENSNIRNGGWQQFVGADLSGKTLGIIGLGNIGKKMATIAKAFDMNVIAWSSNLTQENANEAEVKLVSKETIFKESDFITIHLVLSDRSKATVKYNDMVLMKPTAYLINTSRGPLIDENDLIKILQNKKIAGAALDVFDVEPLPDQHPFRKLPNVLATPHIGFVTNDTYRLFFNDTVTIIGEWINAKKDFV